MARTIVYTCAGPNCQHTKGEGNHWLIVNLIGPHRMVFTDWEHGKPDSPESMHVCGRLCLFKIIDAFLGKLREGESGGGTIEGETTPVPAVPNVQIESEDQDEIEENAG